MKNNLIEISTASVLIILSVLFLNPWHFWMPDMMVVGMLIFALVVFGIFAGYVLRERVVDERDAMHETLAGRNAFLAGVTMVLVGILWQGLQHAVDPWLVVVLVTMLLAKIITRVWSDTHL
jgi:hypothetical protein